MEFDPAILLFGAVILLLAVMEQFPGDEPAEVTRYHQARFS